MRRPAIFFAVLSLNAIAGTDGDYCTIPKLEPGIPAEVSLEYIDKTFCGFALIGGHYQKLDDIIRREEISEVSCDSASACHKTIKYFSKSDVDQEPYIIIFSGPKTRVNGSI